MSLTGSVHPGAREASRDRVGTPPYRLPCRRVSTRRTRPRTGDPDASPDTPDGSGGTARRTAAAAREHP
ncbi:hypothetical protein CP973_15350 [Streptomyces albofaciens JCM 4342]|nr:hypothetical protein CP973_15350 [Streptomyces albofaciens JCM 4342]